MAHEQDTTTPDERRDRQARQPAQSASGGIAGDEVLPIPDAPDGAWIAGANGMNMDTTGGIAGQGEGGPVWPPIGVTQGGAGVGETSAGGATTPTGATIERGPIPGTGGSFEPETGDTAGASDEHGGQSAP